MKTINIIKKSVLTWYLQNEPQSLLGYHDKIRKKEFVEFRHIVHSLCKAYTKESLATIGHALTGKDHASVLHSIKTVKTLLEVDVNFRTKYELIKGNVEKDIGVKKNIYIAGSITKDLETYNWKHVLQKFQDVEDRLIRYGYDVYNPTKFFTQDELEVFQQIDFMRRCIYMIVTHCTHMHMLKDYKDSYNAQIELEIAKNLNLNITYE
ncbi:MAG: DUF4406 domain-containing protein [Spirochaetia bacterium]|nr:DUF4406 domain-containing protein [Spirochaetia bacterium]